MKVIFDPGHAGTTAGLDPGACANDLREAEFTLEVCKLAAAAVRAHGVQVGMTRTGDLNLKPSERAALITQDGIALVVSVHADASPNGDPGPRGWTVYRSVSMAKSAYLGECIAGHMQVPIPSRGVKTRQRQDGSDYYYVIKEPAEVGIPSVLVECGFVTNPDDAAYMQTFWGRFAIAHCLAKGVLSYLNVGAECDQLHAKVDAANQRLGQIAASAQQIRALAQEV